MLIYSPTLKFNFYLEGSRCFLAFSSKYPPLEWLAVLICMAGVLASELFNSSIEELADALHPNFSPGIKKTKDMAAAATLVFSFFSFLIGLIIFIPKLCLLFS